MRMIRVKYVGCCALFFLSYSVLASNVSVDNFTSLNNSSQDTLEIIPPPETTEHTLLSASTTVYLSLGANADQLTNSVNVVMDQFGTTNSYYASKQTNWNVVSGASLQFNHSLNQH